MARGESWIPACAGMTEVGAARWWDGLHPAREGREQPGAAPCARLVLDRPDDLIGDAGAAAGAAFAASGAVSATSAVAAGRGLRI